MGQELGITIITGSKTALGHSEISLNSNYEYIYQLDLRNIQYFQCEYQHGRFNY